MSAGKMHADEIDTDAGLVRRLLAAQFPQWAGLPITPVALAGTQHALYRLGDARVARLPRVGSSTGQLDKEFAWLPKLAPHLPLSIPVPLVLGVPSEDYPWRWSIYSWLAGENATVARIADLDQAAYDLARFITALRRIDPADGPPPGEHNFFRGAALATRDAAVRAALAQMRGMLDTDAAAAAWQACLQAPEWSGPSAWIHGDLQPLNLLVLEGRISGIIDFGGLGVGDPATDLMVAWHLLATESRTVFRAALAADGMVDDAMWTRGRGWALSMGLIALPYYRITNPGLADVARRTIAEVLADYAHST